MATDKTEPMNTFYTDDREIWRQWLAENFETEDKVWFVFPMKGSGEERLSYNDAVEEALCFGWIDSTIRNIDPLHRAQRFSPRKPGSGYSRANIERLLLLNRQGKLHPKVQESVLPLIEAPYEFPADIIRAINGDTEARDNYQRFPEAYKRIRVAYIDAARKRPAEFEKRLKSFIRSAKENRLVGYGGIDKYFIEEKAQSAYRDDTAREFNESDGEKQA